MQGSVIDKDIGNDHMNRQNEYLLQRVETASPVELIRILYGALQAVDQASLALHAGDILKRGRAVTKPSRFYPSCRCPCVTTSSRNTRTHWQDSTVTCSTN